MSDVLELHPTPEEVADFQESDRELWPPQGMSCKVIGCPVTKHYVKFGRYLDHWVEYHQSWVQLLVCSVCKKTFVKSKKSAARKHLKVHSTGNPVLLTERTGNRRYVDPKSIAPPRIVHSYEGEREAAHQARISRLPVVSREEQEQMDLEWYDSVSWMVVVIKIKMSYSLFSKFAFYPTLVYNLFLSKVTSRNWYDRIDDTVLLGALPLRSVAKQLVEEENVRGLVSLTEDFEMSQFVPTEEEWLHMGVRQLKLQTIDYVGTPTQENIHKAVDFILQYRQRRQSVYVHCKAGRTRSSTVVACYLMQVNGWTPEEAVDYIKNKRSHIWLREKQLKSLHTYFDKCSKTGTSTGA